MDASPRGRNRQEADAFDSGRARQLARSAFGLSVLVVINNRPTDVLVKAASEFLAAVLSMLGFVGRPRRRARISSDLDLLLRLRESEDFGPSSPAHGYLIDHVTREAAQFSSVELIHKRKIPWLSVVLSSLIG